MHVFDQYGYALTYYKKWNLHKTIYRLASFYLNKKPDSRDYTRIGLFSTLIDLFQRLIFPEHLLNLLSIISFG